MKGNVWFDGKEEKIFENTFFIKGLFYRKCCRFILVGFNEGGYRGIKIFVYGRGNYLKDWSYLLVE